MIDILLGMLLISGAVIMLLLWFFATIAVFTWILEKIVG